MTVRYNISSFPGFYPKATQMDLKVFNDFPGIRIAGRHDTGVVDCAGLAGLRIPPRDGADGCGFNAYPILLLANCSLLHGGQTQRIGSWFSIGVFIAAKYHDAGIIQQHLLQLGSGPAGSGTTCLTSGNASVLDEEGMQVVDLIPTVKGPINTPHEEGAAILSQRAICLNMSGYDGTAILIIPQPIQGDGPLGSRSHPVRVGDPDARTIHLATESLTCTRLNGLIGNVCRLVRNGTQPDYRRELFFALAFVKITQGTGSCRPCSTKRQEQSKNKKKAFLAKKGEQQGTYQAKQQWPHNDKDCDAQSYPFESGYAVGCSPHAGMNHHIAGLCITCSSCPSGHAEVGLALGFNDNTPFTNEMEGAA